MRIMLQRLTPPESAKANRVSRNTSNSPAVTPKSLPRQNKMKGNNSNLRISQSHFSTSNNLPNRPDPNLIRFINETDDNKRMSILHDLLKDISVDVKERELTERQKNDPTHAIHQDVEENNNNLYRKQRNKY